jgi:hypothetical protein
MDEMASDNHFDDLLELTEGKDYASGLGDDVSADDLALAVWLNEPWLFESRHAKNNRRSPKSFTYFRSGKPPDKIIDHPDNGKLTKLTNLLNRIFQKKRRGRNVKIAMFPEGRDYWFIIRKGEPLSRDGAITPSGESEQIYYRPERFDLAVLRPKVAELRLAIHRKSVWLIEAYRTLFGWVFYKDKEYFSDTEIFTLSPLQENSGELVNCRDVAGIAEVQLAQCRFKTRDGGMITVYGENALDALKTGKMPNLPFYKILSAKFKIRFLKSQRERILTIKSSNIAEFKYDDDGRIIESWLTARGLKIERKESK